MPLRNLGFLLIILAFFIALTVTTLAVGIIIPRDHIDPNTDQLSAEERATYDEAVADVRLQCLDHVIAKGLALRFQFIDFEQLHPGETKPVGTTLRVYTFFGMRMGTYHVVSGACYTSDHFAKNQSSLHTTSPTGEHHVQSSTLYLLTPTIVSNHRLHTLVQLLRVHFGNLREYYVISIGLRLDVLH